MDEEMEELSIVDQMANIRAEAGWACAALRCQGQKRPEGALRRGLDLFDLKAKAWARRKSPRTREILRAGVCSWRRSRAGQATPSSSFTCRLLLWHGCESQAAWTAAMRREEGIYRIPPEPAMKAVEGRAQIRSLGCPLPE
jgi:hypothetical protein